MVCTTSQGILCHFYDFGPPCSSWESDTPSPARLQAPPTQSTPQGRTPLDRPTAISRAPRPSLPRGDLRTHCVAHSRCWGEFSGQGEHTGKGTLLENKPRRNQGSDRMAAVPSLDPWAALLPVPGMAAQRANLSGPGSRPSPRLI